ncbi:MAG: metallophosphoesterase [Rivularia sp. (in: Bacteria)]|nr:metallophosphoesterase [Rivularia sp. MS3]
MKTYKPHKLLCKAKFLLIRLTKSIFILGICILFYAHFIEPNWIDINYLKLKLPSLASEFNGYRIVQISDIHIDKRSKKQRLNHIFWLVNQQKPDLIAITGDFVTRRQKYYAGLYKVGKMFEYTNRGIGMTKLHLRFASRPEITVFILENYK